MRTLFLQINVTLDGYVEDANRDIDWHFSDNEFDEFILGTLQNIDGMVFGRVAFERLAPYWPTAGATAQTEAQREVARLMNELPKYVLSRTTHHTEWNNSHFVGVDDVVKLKSQPGKDLALFAGANVATELTKLGVVDEFRLIVNPLLQGGGTPLFTGTYARQELTLNDVRRFASGALVLTYATA
jgi:dihydrofolate reductase